MKRVARRFVCPGIVCILLLAGCGKKQSETTLPEVATSQPKATEDAGAKGTTQAIKPKAPSTASKKEAKKATKAPATSSSAKKPATKATGVVVAKRPAVQATGDVEAKEPAASQPKKPERPTWIDRPASFFKEPRPDLLLAVGSASTPLRAGKEAGQQEQMEMVARTFAAADARAKLSEALGTSAVKKTVTKDAAGKTVESRTTVTHEGSLMAPEQLAYWKSPDGNVYVLVAVKRAQADPGTKKE